MVRAAAVIVAMVRLLAPLERIVLSRINLRSALGLAALADGAALFLAAPLVLAYTAEPFEYPRRDWPRQVRLVGPGAWDPPAPRPAWLDDDRRELVLVTCSTDFQDDGRLAKVALAALPTAGLRLVVTTARWGDPLATNGEKTCPPVGRTAGRHKGEPMAVESPRPSLPGLADGVLE